MIFFKRMTGLILSKDQETKIGFEAQVADESDMMQMMSYSGRRLTTVLTLEIQPVRLQMSDREIIEWVSNYIRVDEISRAFSREHWAPKSDRQSVAWKVDKRAREVRVRENESSDNESQGRPDRTEWKKEAECFACGQKGHIQSDPECPY